jgi:hypothetical protein
MPFPFFRLPVELRAKVFEELHISTHHQQHPWVYGAPSTSLQPITFTTVRFTLPLQLLRTNKQVYAEASPVLIPKRETIRKLVPKMIAYLRDTDDQSQRDEINVHFKNVQLWLDELRADPSASFDNFSKSNGTHMVTTNLELWNDRIREDFDGFEPFSEQNDTIAANAMPEVHQAGVQLLSRYLDVRRSTAEPVSYFQVQCRVLDGRTVSCRCRDNDDDNDDVDDDDDNNEEDEEEEDDDDADDFDALQRLTSSIMGVMNAGWDLLPRNASGKREVGIGMTDVCGCSGDVYTTYDHKWVPFRFPFPHYGSGLDAGLSDEVKAWKAWEKRIGWVHGEVVELPEHLV